MSIFLPVAGVSISLFVLMGAGGLVGFLSGLLGVGGGFLLTPILMMIGIPATVAAATDSCQIVAASASGGAAHFRLGNVDFKMCGVLLLGGLSGAAVGVELIKLLRTVGNADLLITVAYIIVLGGVGGSMFIASLRSLRRGVVTPKAHRPVRKRSFLNKLPWQMSFPRSKVQHSVLVPFFLCAVVGVLAAIMGVGGGFMMVPMMVYLLRMPPHVAVGTSLFQILFTCAGVTYMQATANHTVDAVLALLLAAGSTVGAQIGARVSRYLRGDQLLIILASLALLVVGEMLLGIVLTPSSLLDVSKSHARLNPRPTGQGASSISAHAGAQVQGGAGSRPALLVGEPNGCVRRSPANLSSMVNDAIVVVSQSPGVPGGISFSLSRAVFENGPDKLKLVPQGVQHPPETEPLPIVNSWTASNAANGRNRRDRELNPAVVAQGG